MPQYTDRKSSRKSSSDKYGKYGYLLSEEEFSPCCGCDAVECIPGHCDLLNKWLFGVDVANENISINNKY